MLVLTRNENQSIIIGKHLVTIKVLEISGQSVRFGIEAPPELSIHREEIYNKIQREEEQLGKPPMVKKEPVIRTISEPSLHDIAERIAQREGDK